MRFFGHDTDRDISTAHTKFVQNVKNMVTKKFKENEIFSYAKSVSKLALLFATIFTYRTELKKKVKSPDEFCNVNLSTFGSVARVTTRIMYAIKKHHWPHCCFSNTNYNSGWYKSEIRYQKD